MKRRMSDSATQERPKRTKCEDSEIPVRPKVVNCSTIPPYLFRVASANGSRGLNTLDEIDPLFQQYGSDLNDLVYHADVTDIDKHKCRMMVEKHVAWDYDLSSEFSSWTASFRYLLVHTRRKSHHKHEHRIVLYVMDTSKLPHSRIRRAKQLLGDAGQENAEIFKKDKKKQKRTTKNKVTLGKVSEGEYLVHGKLNNVNGLWKAIYLEQLEDAGLWTSFNSLSLQHGKATSSVLALRRIEIWLVQANLDSSGRHLQ